MTKVEGGWSAGRELARSDTKGAAPIQLLRQFLETGEVRPLRLWREYEDATLGKRATRWSPGLRKLLLGVEQEASDEELAASEGLDLALLSYVVDGREWQARVKAGTTGELLSEVEVFSALLFLIADLAGVDVQPLELPKVIEHREGVRRA